MKSREKEWCCCGGCALSGPKMPGKLDIMGAIYSWPNEAEIGVLPPPKSARSRAKNNRATHTWLQAPAKKMSLQDTRETAVPIISLVLFVICIVIFSLALYAQVPRFSVDGSSNSVLKLLLALAVLQLFLGVFLLFSPVQGVGITLAFVPLLGIWGYWTLEPGFLVFFAAVEVFFLRDFDALLAAYGSGCQSLYDSDNYCKQGWSSFLVLCTVTYQVFMLMHAFGSFYFFNLLHMVQGGMNQLYGASPLADLPSLHAKDGTMLRTQDNGALHEPLLVAEHTDC
eukprot:m.90749 g.90749  ORF g.90749 m.90749 type:complete len:283 (+) comp18181_c0_seq9:48-896(+)